MKSQELRIGNLVKTIQGNFKVHSIKENEIEICPFLTKEPFVVFINSTQPILLTEEWLLKFGFTSNPYQDVYKLEDFEIYRNGEYFYFRHIELKFVHKLQNLFYEFEDKELKIKL